MSIYLSCFLISLCGLGLSIIIILKSLTTKARLSNVQFEWPLYWRSDFFIQAGGSILTVCIGLLLLNSFLEEYPKYADKTLYIKSFFAFVGYTGSDIASRFFSIVNKRINGAIDYKTTQADEANGTLHSPTPAVKSNPENKLP